MLDRRNPNVCLCVHELNCDWPSGNLPWLILANCPKCSCKTHPFNGKAKPLRIYYCDHLNTTPICWNALDVWIGLSGGRFHHKPACSLPLSSPHHIEYYCIYSDWIDLISLAYTRYALCIPEEHCLCIRIGFRLPYSRPILIHASYINVLYRNRITVSYSSVIQGNGNTFVHCLFTYFLLFFFCTLLLSVCYNRKAMGEIKKK